MLGSPAKAYGQGLTPGPPGGTLHGCPPCHVKSGPSPDLIGIFMSHEPQQSSDPIENIVHTAPVVIPVLGGLMIFLLAFIAVFMA